MRRKGCVVWGFVDSRMEMYGIQLRGQASSGFMIWRRERTKFGVLMKR